MANFGASAGDGTGAAKGAAVAIKRGPSGQGGDLVGRESAEFRQSGQQGRGGQFPDALHLDKKFDLGRQRGRALDQIGDASPEFFDLAVEMAQVKTHRRQEFGPRGLIEPVALAGPVFHQLSAAGDEIGEQDHLRVGFWCGCGLHRLAVIGEQRGINGIGLGEFVAGAGQTRVDHADRDSGLVQGRDEGLLVRPGGFADDVNRPRTLAEAFKQEPKTGCGSGDGTRHG